MRAPLAAALLVLTCGASLAADPGVYSDRVVFGQTAALSGPSAALGRGMRLGLEAAFEEANRGGGVAGRRIELVTLDDRYEPEDAIRNAKRLIDAERVFALVGTVGTPTARATVPIASASGVPFIGPFSGAAFLRDTALSTVVNVRASYAQETEKMMAELVDRGALRRIAVLYQDDTFGRDGLDGARLALQRRGLAPVGTGAFPRNTTAVKTALLGIREAAPQAVVMIGTYKPLAAFVRWARKIGMTPAFLSVSFVGADALAQELGDAGEVVVTQVVPYPKGRSPAAVARYRAALAAVAAEAEPSFTSLEGYVVGRLAVAALGRAGADPSRKALLAGILSGEPFDIDGLVLHFGPGDNQGLNDVYLTRVGGGAVEPISRIVR